MSKYNAKHCEYDGYSFDSVAEGERYLYLKKRLERSKIYDLQVHPKYILQEKFEYDGVKYQAITYEADFSYYDEFEQCTVVEDVKGMATPEAKLKRKMFIKKYCIDDNITLDWVVKSPKYTGTEWMGYDELIKLRKERKKVK